jgi:hypothetical protein
MLSEDDVDNATVALIDEKAKAIDPDLGWQIAPIEHGTRELAISAGGDTALFPKVREVVSLAPKLQHWRIIAFKLRLQKILTVAMDGVTVKPDTVRFSLSKHGNSVDVHLFTDRPGPAEIDEKIGCIFLDEALGEYDAATKVDELSFRQVKTMDEKSTTELQYLGDDVDKLLR